MSMTGLVAKRAESTGKQVTAQSLEADESFKRYVAELTGESYETLLQAPSAVASHQRQVKEQMEELAFKNYKVFIQTAKCTSDIRDEMRKINTNIEDMLGCLPKLTSTSQDFCKKAQIITKARQVTHSTLRQHAILLELLELPQLMDTCVKNNHYEEALELEAYARRIFKQHGSIPVVRDIMDDVKLSTIAMQMQLHQQLRGNVQLPVCLRVIGYLKRLSVYNEKELRYVFLQCRNSYLEECIGQIPTSNVSQHLGKVVDVSRTQLFDIITQYRAIFDHSMDDDPAGTDDAAILFGWVTHKINDFLRRLESKLLEITDGSSISSLLSQCMYFGLSLGRIGVDFRGLLVPIFESAIIRLFQANLQTATQNFSTHLCRYKPTLAHQGLGAFSSPAKRESVLSPPIVLLDYPPVAVLTNGALAAMNELRKCCPVALQTQVTLELESFFAVAVARLRGAPKEIVLDKTAYQDLCRVFADEFLPYTLRCFDSLFKSSRRLLPLEKIQSLMGDLYEKQVSERTLTHLLQGNQVVGSAPSTPTKVQQMTATPDTSRPVTPIPTATNEIVLLDAASELTQPQVDQTTEAPGVELLGH